MRPARAWHPFVLLLPTVAVLGCGVDRPWPAGELAERVAREGADETTLENADICALAAA